MSFAAPVHLSPLVELTVARDTDRDTVSLETLNLGTDDIESVAQESPAAFIRALHKLSPMDRQMLIAYHILRTTQTNLGKVYGFNQTNVAQKLWVASRRLAYHLIFDDLTAEELKPLLEHHGLEQSTLPVPTSMLLDYYLANRDWDELQELCENKNTGTRRIPELKSRLRSTIRKVREKSMASYDDKLQALGAHLDAIITFPGSEQTAQRMARAETNVYIQHPACLGQFRIDVMSPGFKSWLTTRASGPHDEDHTD